MQIGAVRKWNVQLEEEAIQLGFGQWIRPFHLQRILRRKNDEWLVQNMRALAHGHAVFLHCFEQRALRLRCRSVHLVCQDDVREDGPFAKLERFASPLHLVDHSGPQNIGGH